MKAEDVSIDISEIYNNFKKELEKIRYDMVCSNNLYCTDRPDLLTEENKKELLFKTDLNESIQLIDKYIKRLEEE